MLLIFYSADSAIEPRYTLARDPVEGEVPEHLVLEIKLPGMVKIGGDLPFNSSWPIQYNFSLL